MKYILTLFSIFYVYAILRYHIGKGLDSSFGLFVINKAIAWNSAFLLGLSLLKLPEKYPSRRFFGLSSFFLAIVHIVLIFILAMNNKYSELYYDEKLTLKGISILISGALTFLIMLPPFFSSVLSQHIDSKYFHLGKIACFINLFHPFLLGYKNWFSPNDWPYFLPPITLLVVLMNVALITLYYKKRSA